MLEKAYLEIEGKSDRIVFMFNPVDFSMSLTNKWSSQPITGKKDPKLWFAGGGGGKITIPTMMLDTTDTGEAVTTYTDKLFGLMDIDTSLAGYNETDNNGRPPWVKFHWGKTVSIESVITKLDVKFTFFSNHGMPLRAEANVELTEWADKAKPKKQNPTSGTPLPHRVHVVQVGESLDRIAATHYGAADRWRAIAEANGLHDPLDLRPGMSLMIPRLKGVMSG